MKEFSENIVTQLLYERIDREKMPQMDVENIKEFKKILSDNGILFTDEKIEAKKLKPIQGDLSREKVDHFKEEFSKTKKVNPLLVSEDYYILDGHHRWKAGEEENENVRLPVVRVHLPKNRALISLNDAVNRLSEQTNDMTIVAVYPGRFQPFHRGHYRSFRKLQDRFGRNHTYIGTSDKTKPGRSPFNFKEKKEIITTIFDIPSRFVREVKSPYAAKEILQDYDDENTVFVVALGKKDSQRLSGGKYFEEFDSSKKLEPYSETGYYYVIDKGDEEFKFKGQDISGTQVRKVFASDEVSTEGKKELFKFIYGTFNQNIFDLIVDKLESDSKLSEQIRSLVESDDFKKKLNEAARTGAAVPADDGPASWYTTSDSYSENSSEIAKRIGYEVLDYLFDREDFEARSRDLKTDALPFVSFFPSGVFDKHVEDPLRTYLSFSDAVATSAGYEIMKHIGVDEPEEKESVVDDDESGEESARTRDDMVVTHSDELTESVKRLISEVTVDQVRDHAEKLIDRVKEIDDYKEYELFTDTIGPFRRFVQGCINNGFLSDYYRKNINKKLRNIEAIGDLQKDKQKLINVLNYVKEKAKPVNERKTLKEGGAFGHLAHPFEDMQLTFGDLKKMIRLAFSGDLDVEGKVREKTDGQNLMITWKGGELRAARNKGHLRNFGENSLDVRGIIDKFEGRGDIKDAFEYTMKDLSHAFSKLSDDQLEDIFMDGKRFMSLEVIFPPTQNVIPYGKSLLIFHGLTEYDEDGNAIDYSSEYADQLASIIKDVNADIQDEFKIGKQPELKLKNIKTDKGVAKKLLNRLNELRNRYGLDKDDEVVLYHQAWWENFIREKADEYEYDIPEHVVNGLVRRWAYGEKSGEDGYSVREMKKDIEDEEFLQFVRQYDKQNYKNQFKKNVRPFELIFLRLGSEVMKQAELALAADEKAARQSIIDQLEQARREILASGDESAIEKMNQEFERLDQIGGMESVVPSEGAIFKYKGDLFKLTGSFAPVNQILGIMRYRI